MTSQELDGLKPGGMRYYAHAFQKINPVVGEPFNELTIPLQPGATVRAKVLDSAGKPIDYAIAVSRLFVAAISPFWRSATRYEIRDGVFEVSGLSESEEYPVYILDAKNRLGATALIRKSDPEPTFILKPCGTAKARFVNSDGSVRTDMAFDFNLVVTPGVPRYDFEAARNGEKAADEDFVANIDRAGTELSRTTSSTGEIVYENLIPGATYRFTKMADGKVTENVDFIAKSGETIDLKDIVLPSDK